MTAAPAAASNGAFAPFRHRVYAILWTATLLSNVGTWMHDVAAGWLMASLSPSPFVVSAVQATTTAAMALFALPAGALADRFDRRKLLLGLVAAKGVIALGLAALTFVGLVTPIGLLAITFALGICSAVMAPAWQSIVPMLVPRDDLRQAVAMNAMGINVARALGPAFGGYVVVKLGAATAFLANALSEVAILFALYFWKPAAPPAAGRRAEGFVPSMVSGLRFAAHASDLKSVLWRAAAFFPFASAYWALLPLVARDRLAGDATLFGALVAAIGAGAVAGALAMPRLGAKLGSEGMLAAGAGGTALALAVYAVAPWQSAALAVSLVAGASWIFVLSTLNVAAQDALPDWVRGRGLSIYGLVFFGCMTLGALCWGYLAASAGIPIALAGAAAGMIAVHALARRRPLATGRSDLVPAGHWPEPPAVDVTGRGPAMIQIEYRIDRADRDAFLVAIHALAEERRRDGAYIWEVFEDPEDAGRFLEVFVEASWEAHLLHHARVTKEDADVQAKVAAFHRGVEPPKVAHWLAP